MKKLIISLDESFKKHENITKKTLKGLEKLFNLKTKYIEIYLVRPGSRNSTDKYSSQSEQVEFSLPGGNIESEKKLLSGNFNVLSFPAPKDFPRPDVKNYETIGEIYLNPIYIERNNENFIFMFVHGFLHLMGYDHKIKSDAIIMERKEAEIMAQLSIADVNIADGKQ